MKLKYLWVEKYKNLKNIEINFPENYSAFIGTNGSGKSNLIEVLAYVFSSLYEKLTPKLDFNWSEAISNSANTGIYFLESKILKEVSDNDNYDFFQYLFSDSFFKKYKIYQNF